MRSKVERGVSAIMLRYDNKTGLTMLTHLFTFDLGKGKRYTAIMDSFPFPAPGGFDRLTDHFLDGYAPMIKRVWKRLLFKDEDEIERATWLEMRGGLTPRGAGFGGNLVLYRSCSLGGLEPRGAGFGDDWVLWAEL